MLKKLGLIGTVLTCSMGLGAFAEEPNVNQYKDFHKNPTLVEAVQKQISGSYSLQTISPEKINEIISVARNQFRIYNAKSIDEGREYGGVIYERNGVVQATETVIGKKCKSECGINFDAQYNQLLKEAKTEKIIIYADWHTHGDSSDNFSNPDREGMIATMNELHKRGHVFMGCFYANPSGVYRLVTYDKNEDSLRRAFTFHAIGNDKELYFEKLAMNEKQGPSF